jgi:hypothetical protein
VAIDLAGNVSVRNECLRLRMRPQQRHGFICISDMQNPELVLLQVTDDLSALGGVLLSDDEAIAVRLGAHCILL